MHLTKLQIDKAKIWLSDHRVHVLELIKHDGSFSYPPDDIEDMNNPALWKGAHWRWFIENVQSVLTK